MRPYIAPAFWLLLGLLNTVSVAGTVRMTERRSLDPERRAALMGILTARWRTILSLAIAAYCCFSAVASELRHRPQWWLWALATVALVAAELNRRRVVARLGVAAAAQPKTASQRRRDRRVGVLLAVAAVALFGGQALGSVLHTSHEAIATVILVIAIVTFFGSVIAAAWASN